MGASSTTKPPSPSQAAHTQWWVASLVLNLLLAAYLLRPRPTNPSPLESDVVQLPAQEPARASVHRPHRVLPGTQPAVLDTPWSRIESTNLTVFAANLREAGCPDETVCDLLRPAAARWFTQCIRRANGTGDFWAVGVDRQKLRRKQAMARAALREEQDRFLAALPCSRSEAFEQAESLIIDMVTGFPPSPKREQLRDLFQEIQRRYNYWRERTGLIFLPEEVEAIHRERDNAMARLGSLLSATERQEVALRAYAIPRVMDSLPKELQDLYLTGPELREYCRIMVSTDAENTVPWSGYRDLLSEGDPVPSKAQTDRELLSLLGEVRFQQYQIHSDPTFAAASQLVHQFGQPESLEIQLTESVVDWKSQVAALHEAWSTDPEGTQNALRSGAQAKRALLETLMAGIPEDRRNVLIKSWVVDAAREIWSKP